MARVINSLIGELRGKLGGTVYSRNAAGPIVRAKSKPTNPNTGAQQAARLSFRTAGKAYQTLTQSLQGGWNTFAKNVYNPFKKKNSGQFTASQAYAGICAQVANANKHVGAFTCQLYGGTTVITGITCANLTGVITPPLVSVAPNIVDTASVAASYKVRGIYMSAANIVTVDLDVQGMAGVAMTAGDFKDNKGNPYGFSVYISSPVNFQGARPSSQYHSLLAFSGIPTKTPGPVVGCHGFRITLDASAFMSVHKNLPTAGQIFMLSLVLIAANGTATKVDSFYVVYGTAAPTIPA